MTADSVALSTIGRRIRSPTYRPVPTSYRTMSPCFRCLETEARLRAIHPCYSGCSTLRLTDRGGCRQHYRILSTLRYEPVRRAFLAMACLLGLAGGLSTQSTNALLHGPRTDASQARIVSAKVTTIHTDPNILLIT